MSTSKKFAVAGVSTLEGKTKLRFANDTMRIKILDKNGHTDVELIELPHAMTKGEIAQYMTEIGFGAGKPGVEDAIAYIAKKNPVGAAGTSEPTEAAANAEVVAEDCKFEDALY